MPHDRLYAITRCVSDVTQNNRQTRGREKAGLGVAKNTIFIFTSDNGPDPTRPHTSFAGPWSGSYFTGKEGSLRVPFIIRWPGNIPAGAVSNEIVHQTDLYPTIARIAGGGVPKDRVIDGVDQLAFFTGQQASSNREHVIVYVGNELYGVKWRNYKIMGKEIDKAFADPTRSYGVPLIYDLHVDPKEEAPLTSNWYHVGWVRWPASKYLVQHLGTLKAEPPIKPGTPDPYLPGPR
jgi:arylsulfatase A-like enzyme